MVNTYTIYRVHKHLRGINEKAYEPEIVAIGPYHHGKDSLKMMEEHKKRYLDSLLKRKRQKIEIYTSAMKEIEKHARMCYAEPISLSSGKFTEMLVRDGCFIIELIRKSGKNDPTLWKGDPIFQMDWMMKSLQRDLLLFENQMPFFVLCKLFDLVVAPRQHKRLIFYVSKFWENLFPGERRNSIESMRPQKINHFLDIVHQYHHPSLPADHVSLDIALLSNDEVILKKRRHLVDLVHFILRPILAAKYNHKVWESIAIPSASELTNANVEFRAKTEADSTLFDVEFEEGTMLMPPLTIDDRTVCFLRNFIAYEEYFTSSQPNYIMDYARLLNCLIDSPRDVEILSRCGIIKNELSDQEVVAIFVNRLTRTVSGPRGDFIYAATFESINSHYNKRWNRARAVLRRDYFNSPWAFIAFLAASVILLLTIVQTVCSILEVV